MLLCLFASNRCLEEKGVSVIVLFIIYVLLYIPTLSMYKVGCVKEPLLNTSYSTLVKDPLKVRMFKQGLNNTVNKNTLQLTAFIILVTCASILSFKPCSHRKYGHYKKNSNKAYHKSHTSNQTRPQKLSPKIPVWYSL